MSPARDPRSLPDQSDPAIEADAEITTPSALRRASKRPRTRGQSMVEFALLLPLLILILALSADFGRAFTAYIAVSGAAGSGANYGMQNITQAGDKENIQRFALDNLPNTWGADVKVFSTPTCDPPKITLVDSPNYSCVTVTVEYTFRPIIQIPPIMGPYTVSRTVWMRVIG